jgi:hypothetical protein
MDASSVSPGPIGLARAEQTIRDARICKTIENGLDFRCGGNTLSTSFVPHSLFGNPCFAQFNHFASNPSSDRTFGAGIA